MSLLSELNNILDSMNIPVETGAFSGSPPEYYAVLTPITDVFGFFADNIPQNNIEEVRISLFDKGNYNEKKNRLELLTSPGELAEYKYAITAAMMKGTKRNVESEDTSKNAVAAE